MQSKTCCDSVNQSKYGIQNTHRHIERRLEKTWFDFFTRCTATTLTTPHASTHWSTTMTGNCLLIVALMRRYYALMAVIDDDDDDDVDGILLAAWNIIIGY